MCILSLGLYAIYKVDGYQYIVRKMIINEKREYKKRGRYYNIRVDREEKANLSKVKIPKNMVNLTLKQLQVRIMKNKIKKGFNLDPKKIEVEYVCLGEEISEMFMALRKGNKEEFLEALTDLFIYLVGLFGIFKVDSYELITQKIALNEKRVYQKSKSGHLVRENQVYK